jgi:hypothetical protein
MMGLELHTEWTTNIVLGCSCGKVPAIRDADIEVLGLEIVYLVANKDLDCYPDILVTHIVWLEHDGCGRIDLPCRIYTVGTSHDCL